jgi:hypothetical protein
VTEGNGCDMDAVSVKCPRVIGKSDRFRYLFHAIFRKAIFVVWMFLGIRYYRSIVLPDDEGLGVYSKVYHPGGQPRYFRIVLCMIA